MFQSDEGGKKKNEAMEMARFDRKVAVFVWVCQQKEKHYKTFSPSVKSNCSVKQIFIYFFIFYKNQIHLCHCNHFLKGME